MKRSFHFLAAPLILSATLFGLPIRFEGLGWQDPPRSRPIFSASLSNETLVLILDREDGRRISITPVGAKRLAEKAKWKTASAVVKRGPDVLSERLILEGNSGKPLLLFCKNEKRAFHPLSGWEVNAGADLGIEESLGRIKVGLRFTRMDLPAESFSLAPDQSKELRLEGELWRLQLLSATRSLPPRREISDEEAPLLFDCILQRI